MRGIAYTGTLVVRGLTAEVHEPRVVAHVRVRQEYSVQSELTVRGRPVQFDTAVHACPASRQTDTCSSLCIDDGDGTGHAVAVPGPPRRAYSAAGSSWPAGIRRPGRCREPAGNISASAEASVGKRNRRRLKQRNMNTSWSRSRQCTTIRMPKILKCQRPAGSIFWVDLSAMNIAGFIFRPLYWLAGKVFSIWARPAIQPEIPAEYITDRKLRFAMSSRQVALRMCWRLSRPVRARHAFTDRIVRVLRRRESKRFIVMRRMQGFLDARRRTTGSQRLKRLVEARTTASRSCC